MSRFRRRNTTDVVRSTDLCVRRGRRAISLLALLISLVIVVLAAVSVASTIVAVRATEARRRAVEDTDRAIEAIGQSVVAAANAEELKGISKQAARAKLLEPALEFYEAYAKAHENDPVVSPGVAEAYLRIAGLKAKLGSMESVAALNNSVRYMEKMIKANVDPEKYPSVRECAMDVAPPNEWLLLRNASFTDLPKHGARLFIAINGAVNTFQTLSRQYPQAVKPRDELSNVLRYAALMQARQNRTSAALNQWGQARDILETLVRDKPDNSDYKARLAEALVAVGGLQKKEGNTDEGIKSYEQAIKLQEQLVSANPDDKQLAADLEAAKEDLAKLQAAPAAKVEPTPPSKEVSSAQTDEPDKEESASPMPPDDASGETPGPPDESGTSDAAPEAKAGGDAAADAPGDSADESPAATP